MTRKKDEKNALEEACKVAREAAKNATEKPGKWPERGEVLGALELISGMLDEMDKTKSISSVIPLAINLANAYNQKTINAAFLLLFEHLDDGLLKIMVEGVTRTLMEQEKEALVHRIFSLSFIVNGMFLFDREERTTL